jgi:Ca2+-binding RTX toxin-like protein
MAILTVGQNQQYATLSSAVAATHDGDTIYVQAGTYYNDFATIQTKISIVGVGGMAHFVATQPPSNGKGILTTKTDVNIDHLELSGAAVSAGNGAGVRYEGGKLTITNSYIHDNQDGIRTAAIAGGVINIDRTEFDHNGAGDGQSHNIYISQIATFQMTNSYSHDAVVGHEVKSRALTTILTNNRIIDENGSASYSIDLPNGGNATIQNNLIQQGPYSQNPAIIAYAKESAPYAGSKLVVSGNTILNQKSGTSVYVVSNASSLTPQITGNHFFGLTSAQISNKAAVQSGNDWLASYPAIDTSHPWSASPWNTLISGGAGNDVLKGSTGNDLFVGAAGADVFKAGTGSDTVADLILAQADKVDLSAIAGYTSLSAVSLHMTQNLADTVIDLGSGNSLTLKNVTAASLPASAFLFSASSGTSTGGTPTGGTTTGGTTAGTSGSDTLNGSSGADTLAGGLGDDHYTVNSAGDVVIEKAGEGTDSVQASIDYILPANVENLTLTGSAAIDGTGNALANALIGNAAANTLEGLGGADALNGGSGIDTATYESSSSAVNVSLLGAAGIGGDGSGDVLTNIENLIGSAFGDTILGNTAANSLWGDSGHDSIRAGSGDDTVDGGVGSDILIGAAGNDLLLGGPGTDSLSGNTGADRFIFQATADSPNSSARDVITDFIHAEADKIDVSAIDASTATSGDQPFAFIGTQSFHHIAGELHYSAGAGGVIVSGDVNGDGVADFSIDVSGVTALVASDFVL